MEKPAKSPATARKGGNHSTSRRKEDWIGRQLRRVYDDVLSEPLPDDLTALLRQIEDQAGADRNGSAKGPGSAQ